MSFRAINNDCLLSSFGLKNDSFSDEYLTDSVLLWMEYFGFSTFYTHTTSKNFCNKKFCLSWPLRWPSSCPLRFFSSRSSIASATLPGSFQLQSHNQAPTKWETIGGKQNCYVPSLLYSSPSSLATFWLGLWACPHYSNISNAHKTFIEGRKWLSRRSAERQEKIDYICAMLDKL